MESECGAKKVKKWLAQFRILSEEANTLKLVFSTIVTMSSGIRNYPGLKSLDDSFESAKILIKQRVGEINSLLLELNSEAKKFDAFMREPPEGGIQ